MKSRCKYQQSPNSEPEVNDDFIKHETRMQISTISISSYICVCKTTGALCECTDGGVDFKVCHKGENADVTDSAA